MRAVAHQKRVRAGQAQGHLDQMGVALYHRWRVMGDGLFRMLAQMGHQCLAHQSCSGQLPRGGECLQRFAQAPQVNRHPVTCRVSHA